MRILIVENAATELSAVHGFLLRKGFDIKCAGRLDEAQQLLQNSAFDAILLDLLLPDSNGIETFLSVKSIASGTPILVFTDLDDGDVSLETLRNGAEDFLLRASISNDSLYRCIQYAVERNRGKHALHREQERLRTILQNAYDAFLSTDCNWRITDWNEQAEQTFGWKRSQAIGKGLGLIMPHHLRKQYLKNLDHYFSLRADKIAKMTEEIVALHKDGHEVSVELSVFRLLDDDQHSFCAFARDITEKTKTKQDLERLVQERTSRLTQTNEELRQFAKIASHDLQEPLRTVEGFVDLLADQTRGTLDQSATEFLDYILDGTRRMRQLIRSVLVHSEIDAENSYDCDTDCNEAIAEVMSGLSGSIAETQTTIDFEPLPHVAVSRALVCQLFQNLLSNSMKYKGIDKPAIVVKAERSLDSWLFSVTDNSIGIEPKYANRVFDMFSRLHGQEQYPGTGIGLAICKRIVTTHGGSIWVESQLGQGSIFLFTLPAVVDKRKRNMKDSIEILLVEDTPSDVRLTQEALKRSNINYEMTIVSDGVEAMDYLLQLKRDQKALPNIILLDLNMPKKNGHEVLDEIKQDPVLRNIPVVLLTVSDRDEDVLEALRLKMNYYLGKPVTSDKLSVLIRCIYSLYSVPGNRDDLVTNEDIHIKQVLAGNPHTAAVALKTLADDPSYKVRMRVAENPQVSLETLSKLVHDSCSDVRLSAAENPKTPGNLLEVLAKDTNEDVRMGMATNPGIPEYVLKLLTADDNVFVASRAKKTLAGARPV